MGQGKLWLLLAAVVAATAIALLVVWRPFTPAGPVTATCEGRAATIIGDSDASEVLGTDGDDVIVGVGDHPIRAGKGDDLICSPVGGGDDIDAGPGNDRVIGGNVVRGGTGRDIISVTNASLVDGGPGDDEITSRGLAATLDGGEGDDVIISEGSAAITTGGAGDDTVTEIDGRNTHGGPGRDHLVGRGIGHLNGDAGNDRLEAGAEASVMFWDGPGDDTYRVGGNGRVTVNYYFSERAIRLNLSTGRATGQGRDRLIGVRAVAGSHHDDVLIGDRAANTITGLIWWEGERDDATAAGADRVSGGAGDDDLEALGPDSVVRGEEGDDVIRVSGRGFGGTGADRLTGDTTDDDLRGGPGRDTVDGGEGNDGCTAEVVSRCER